MDRAQITETLKAHRRMLGELGIRSVSLFGSVARGEAGVGSDIDLLVEFDRPVGLFHFARARRELSAILGHPVDLVTREALRPEFRDRILKEAVRAA
jgi:predicted nucleotidyltransferase